MKTPAVQLSMGLALLLLGVFRLESGEEGSPSLSDGVHCLVCEHAAQGPGARDGPKHFGEDLAAWNDPSENSASFVPGDLWVGTIWEGYCQERGGTSLDPVPGSPEEAGCTCDIGQPLAALLQLACYPLELLSPKSPHTGCSGSREAVLPPRAPAPFPSTWADLRDAGRVSIAPSPATDAASPVSETEASPALDEAIRTVPDGPAAGESQATPAGSALEHSTAPQAIQSVRPLLPRNTLPPHEQHDPEPLEPVFIPSPEPAELQPRPSGSSTELQLPRNVVPRVKRADSKPTSQEAGAATSVPLDEAPSESAIRQEAGVSPFEGNETLLPQGLSADAGTGQPSATESEIRIRSVDP